MQNYIYEVTLTGDRDLVVEVARTGIVTVRLGNERRSVALPSFARIVRLNPEAVEVAVGERDGVEGMYLTLADGSVWWVGEDELRPIKIESAEDSVPQPTETVYETAHATAPATAPAMAALESQPESVEEQRPSEFTEPAPTPPPSSSEKNGNKRYSRVKEVLERVLRGKLSEDEIRNILNALDTYKPKREREPEDAVTKALKKFVKYPIIGDIKVGNHTFRLTPTSVELLIDGQVIRSVKRPKPLSIGR
ncbi:hypothetical protein GG496_001516 [Candidatus Fervidibacteria bacterium JGI MDM2 JNZ-1-D12]